MTPTPAQDEWLISVDSHAIESPTTFTSRLPAKYVDRAPRWTEIDEGEGWVFEDKKIFVNGLAKNIFPEQNRPGQWDNLTWQEVPASCYDPAARVVAMDQHRELAALLFPNQVGFCGSLFQNAEDKDLAYLCIQAWNDWLIEEWVEAHPGRFIGMGIVPLWDGKLAAAEAQRVIAKGAKAISFAMAPDKVGFPALSDEHWTPLFSVLNDARVSLCTHVGTDIGKAGVGGAGVGDDFDMAKMLKRVRDDDERVMSDEMADKLAQLPQSVIEDLKKGNISTLLKSITPTDIQLASASASLTGAKSGKQTIEGWMRSGVFATYPQLKLALSECGVGWIPAALSFADWQEEMRRMHFRTTGQDPAWARKVNDDRLPSEVFKAHIYGCFIQEPITPALVDALGEDNIMIETDYPHIATNWPDSMPLAQECLAAVSDAHRFKIMRGNAETLFDFKPAEPPALVG